LIGNGFLYGRIYVKKRAASEEENERRGDR